ncbi:MULTISPECIES: GNAT family N-acetyltransferase [Gracilibacillus]|uniref:GNAT family N-acetyltransferase n=1 Tax=Gracilibacillus TaxID=74385 RepID=UPI0008247D01|nr:MULTISPECIES: GNAT family N-acetyltransferase [Gracilibacillus]
MSITYKFSDSIEQDHYTEAVWQILCECDQEFIPALSSRESSYQADLGGAVSSQHVQPHAYFDEMKKQVFLVAIDQDSDQVVGFMTFKHGYQSDPLKNFSPSNYITTICITKQARNQGITKGFYQALIQQQIPSAYQLNFISTRTWSTNAAHIHVLQKLGFVESAVLPDHRGAGIDTIYFAKQVDDNG